MAGDRSDLIVTPRTVLSAGQMFLPPELRSTPKKDTPDTIDVDLPDLPLRPDGQARHRLADVSDRTFYSVGPLYEVLELPFDLMERFAASCGDPVKQLEIETHVYQEKVFPGMQSDWARILQSIPTAICQQLINWLSIQVYVRRDFLGRIESVFGVYCKWVAVSDPLDKRNPPVKVLTALPRRVEWKDEAKAEAGGT